VRDWTVRPGVIMSEQVFCGGEPCPDNRFYYALEWGFWRVLVVSDRVTIMTMVVPSRGVETGL